MAIIPLARFAPDASALNTDALSQVNNARPERDGWGPIKQIVPTPAIYDYLVDEDGNHLTDEDGNRLVVATDWSGLGGEVVLPGAATAYFRATKRDGSEAFFAGTETGLFLYNQTSNVWEDVSLTTYASAVPWIIRQHGDYVLAQNGFNSEQLFDVENDTVFSNNTSAPICKALEIVKGFAVRGNIVSWASEGYTNEPSMMMCSAFNDPTDNVLQNRNFCDFQIFPLGTEIKTFLPFGDGCIVEMKDGRYPVSFVLTEYTFTSGDFIQGGTPAPYSAGLIESNDYVIYRDNGFWRVNGGGNIPIGDGKVNAFFLGDCDQAERESIRACVDPENLICWWAYTDVDGYRKMIGYHYVLNEWTMSDLDVVVSAQARTVAYGSTITTEGLLRFSIIDSNGQRGYLVGDTAAASFGTNEVLHSRDRSWINGLRLIADTSDYYVIVTTRDVLGGTPRARSAAVPSTRSGLVPVRADGRSHKYDFTIPAGAIWSTASAADVDVMPSSRS